MPAWRGTPNRTARCFVLGALLLLAAAVASDGRARARLLPLEWLSGDSGQELELSGVARRFWPALRPARRRLASHHHGALRPARAALTVGEDTWVATPAGAVRFGPELWSAPRQARPRARCATGQPVNALRAIGEGTVELGTDERVIAVDATCRRRAAPEDRGRRVTALGPTLAGTFSGLLRRPSGNVLLPEVPITAMASCRGATFLGTHDRGLLLWHSGRALTVPGLERGRVAALSACREGPQGPEVLAAATGGLFEVRSGRASRVPGGPLHATAVLPLGADLMVGAFDEGLLLLRGGSRRALPVPGRVTLLHRGPEGAVLVGTDRGLFVWRAGSGATRLAWDGPPPGPVTALALQGETLWAGTFDAGLARRRGTDWEEVAVFDPRITSLHADPSGGLWVGTASGLGRLQGDRVVRVPDRRGWLRRHVASLRGDAAMLWVAVHPGLVVLDTSASPPALEYLGARGKEADAGLPGPTIYAVARGRGGLWVGSDDGLGRLDGDGAHLLTDLGGVLPDNWVNDVRSEGDVVAALTLRSGLLRLSPTGSEVFSTGLMTSPGVLLLAGDRILFGTNASGLVALTEGDGGPELRSYGPDQGLPSAMVTSLLHDPARDRLWVGGSAGLTRIENVGRSLGLRRTR